MFLQVAAFSSCFLREGRCITVVELDFSMFLQGVFKVAL